MINKEKPKPKPILNYETLETIIPEDMDQEELKVYQDAIKNYARYNDPKTTLYGPRGFTVWGHRYGIYCIEVYNRSYNKRRRSIQLIEDGYR